MTVQGKLITGGAVSGCIGAALLVIQWYVLSGPEGRLWEYSATPKTAQSYVRFADDLEYESAIRWRLMRASPSMRAHLEQRRREAAAYEATLPKAPPPLSDAERRKKMRDDYEKSAAAIHLSPGMTAAMLALIDQGNARAGAIPIRVTVKNTVQAGGDSDLELALKPDGNGLPAFNPEYGCGWDQRQHSEPLDLTHLGVENEGIFITITLKDVPEPLVLKETGGGRVERAECAAARCDG